MQKNERQISAHQRFRFYCSWRRQRKAYQAITETMGIQRRLERKHSFSWEFGRQWFVSCWGRRGRTAPRGWWNARMGIVCGWGSNRKSTGWVSLCVCLMQIPPFHMWEARRAFEKQQMETLNGHILSILSIELEFEVTSVRHQSLDLISLRSMIQSLTRNAHLSYRQ